MITINILRISSDRKYLQLDVETLSNYTFNNLYIWEYTDSDRFDVDETTKNLNSHFQNINNQEVLQIELSEEGLSGDTMYYIQLEVEWDGTGDEFPEDYTSEDTEKKAAVADLSQSYFTKVKLLREGNRTLNCTNLTIPDLLIELFTYEQMTKSCISLERFDDANFWYGKVKTMVQNYLIDL